MPSSFRLLCLTDTHIFLDPQERLCGLDTSDSLRNVVAGILEREKDFDAVLLTGDLCHEQGAEAYKKLAGLLAPLKKPCFALPGNHDNPTAMKEGFQGSKISMEGETVFGSWRALFLNSAVPNENYGFISPEELDRLKNFLEKDKTSPVLVALHHNPVPVHSTWMDSMIVKNNEAFLSILDKNPQVRALLWGHVHQAFDSSRFGVRLMATPSTSVQFAPVRQDFGLDKIYPGYRALTLSSNGAISTRVERVPSPLEYLDENSAGY